MIIVFKLNLKKNKSLMMYYYIIAILFFNCLFYMKDNQNASQFKVFLLSIHNYLIFIKKKKNHKKNYHNENHDENHEKIHNDKSDNEMIKKTFRKLKLVN